MKPRKRRASVTRLGAMSPFGRIFLSSGAFCFGKKSPKSHLYSSKIWTLLVSNFPAIFSDKNSYLVRLHFGRCLAKIWHFFSQIVWSHCHGQKATTRKSLGDTFRCRFLNCRLSKGRHDTQYVDIFNICIYCQFCLAAHLGPQEMAKIDRCNALP
jgi:hypothetical protein